MSYCRSSDESDVYAYHNIQGGFDLHISGGKDFHFNEPEDFHAKLIELRNTGLKVPQYAIDRIEREIKEGKYK